MYFCREIRECLKLDSDHKRCHDHYKKVKKLVQTIHSVEKAISEQDWPDCILKVQQMLKLENHIDRFVDRAASHFCHCHSQVIFNSNLMKEF